jgi:hypothetical protein
VADDHLSGRFRPFEQEFMDHGAFDQGGSAGAKAPIPGSALWTSVCGYCV